MTPLSNFLKQCLNTLIIDGNKKTINSHASRIQKGVEADRRQIIWS